MVGYFAKCGLWCLRDSPKPDSPKLGLGFRVRGLVRG